MITFIKCHVCIRIEKKEKVLMGKWQLFNLQLFYLHINKGKSTIYYEDFQPLFEFLKLQSIAPKIGLTRLVIQNLISHIKKRWNRPLKLSSVISSLYPLHVMKSHPWIPQVGQVCMLTLCKNGVKYPCCWMCNMWYMDFKLMFWLW